MNTKIILFMKCEIRRKNKRKEILDIQLSSAEKEKQVIKEVIVRMIQNR